jgi:hypothetical protein
MRRPHSVLRLHHLNIRLPCLPFRVETDLPIALLLTESQWHIVALQGFAGTSPTPDVHWLGVPTIDKHHAALIQIEPSVAEGGKDAKTDELPGDVTSSTVFVG